MERYNQRFDRSYHLKNRAAKSKVRAKAQEQNNFQTRLVLSAIAVVLVLSLIFFSILPARSEGKRIGPNARDLIESITSLSPGPYSAF